MNLSSLDFNLLKVLDALIAERNVTRAGKRLGRSQPAVSNALQRLRHITGDDLLVRGPNGFVLTPRAEAMREPLREAIALVESCVAGVPRQFDPKMAGGVFRLSTPDRLSIAVVPALLSRLQKAAPEAALHVITAERQRALELLDADRTDCALGWFDEKPAHCSAELLMEENLFCVFRRDHPILRRGKHFDIKAVLSYPHVVVSASGQGSAIFDELLKRNGLSRRALVAVTNFTAVPALLGGSDMIGVFTKLAADVFQTSFGLAKRPVPLEIGKIATQMVWPLRYDRDPRHLWLRQQIKAVYREF
jgi:DNA-binding transcriptional LysR family regulator